MKKKILSFLCLTAILLTLFMTAPAAAKNDDADSFPPRYDPRELGLVTAVKNQNPYGTCWAFAIASSMESNALVKGYGAYDLSEYQLAYMCTHAATDGASSEEIEGPVCKDDWRKGPYGGILSSSLMKGCAIQGEEAYPYSNMEQPLPEEGFSMDGELYVDSCYTVPASDQHAMKKLILENGALYIHICALCWWDESGKYCDLSTGAAYLPKYTRTDHVVSIVGWDDGYSRDNFRTTPPGDGAWIVKNSWGTDLGGETVTVGDQNVTTIGDNGFFYISYYDAAFNSLNCATSVTVTKERNYDRIYQYDLGAGLLYAGKVTDVVIQITASENGSIAGVRIKPTGRINSAYFFCGDWAFEETKAQLSVCQGVFDAASTEDAEPIYTQEYAVSYPDYQAVHFDKEVEISKGEAYYIRVSFDHPVCYALDGHQSYYYSYENRASGAPGETYIRTERSDGTGDWYDTVKVPGKTGPCSACIKVLTKDR